MIANTVVPTQASPTLTLTVTTDRLAYYPEENVTIYGNLTENEALVPDGLVAIQGRNPNGQTYVIRTTTTGTPPPGTPYVKVRSVIPCNSTGGPKDSFKRGSLAWFNITITNYDIEPRPALLTVNIYDSSNTPIAYDSTGPQFIAGQFTSSAILCVGIPEEAVLGTATAYGNVYTDWPSEDGWPYCTEVSATFQITNGELSQSITTITAQANGNYNTTFKLKYAVKAGNHTVYVTTRYMGETAVNNTTFHVKLLGDIDGDGKVNYRDLYLILMAYGSTEEDPNYEPEADFNRDGTVNYKDLFALLKNYGKTE
jgi:hypothetical protein